MSIFLINAHLFEHKQREEKNKQTTIEAVATSIGKDANYFLVT